MKNAHFKINPLEIVLQIYNDLYPNKPASIQFVENSKELKNACGVTQFADDRIPEISLVVDLPFKHLIEILVHELAHVAVGIDVGHGKLWKESFEKQHKRFCDVIEKRING